MFVFVILIVLCCVVLRKRTFDCMGSVNFLPDKNPKMAQTTPTNKIVKVPFK